MSDTKFTKGEWKVFEYGKPHWNNEGLPHVPIHYGDNEEHIVDTVYELADAHLIAAAPEMYDALENLIDVVKGIHGDPEVINAYKCHYELSDISNAELALEKARGE